MKIVLMLVGGGVFLTGLGFVLGYRLGCNRTWIEVLSSISKAQKGP